MIPLPCADGRSELVVLADGDYPRGEVALGILSHAVRVVCCDGAAAPFIASGGRPWAIVGDCDSLPRDVAERYGDIIFRDGDQESNDLTKAVRHCIARSMRDITILGATGCREDHTLGNISLLASYAPLVDSVRIVTDHGVFDPIVGDALFESRPGQQVSVFTLSPRTLVTTDGLRYPLRDAPLDAWWQGTLNESTGPDFTVRTTGPAIMFRVF